MILTFMILLLFKGVLSTSDIAPFICPKPSGHFPSPYDCASYYECADGIATETTCPFGKLYNLELGECDNAQKVDCSNIFLLPIKDSSQSTTVFSSISAESAFACPEPDGYFPDPDACDAFYICEAGIASRQQCPPGLVFNVDLETCDYDFNVPPPCGTLSTSTSAPFVCPEPNGYFSNPNSCLSFYICTDGTESIQYCAERLVYNPQKKTCDFPHNVQPPCGTLSTSTEAKTTHTTQQTSETTILVTETTGSEAPSSETTLVSSTAGPFVCPEPDGYFSNPDSCFSFYICIDGTETIQYCAERLVYNPQKKTCDFPHNVAPPCGTCTTDVCVPGSTTHKTTSATPDKTTESGPPSGTTDHLPETTASFVTTNLNSQTTFAPPTSGPFVCPEPDGYFSNPESCYSFYICYEGTENIRYCAEGLVYNPPKRTCDYPHNVAPPCGTCTTDVCEPGSTTPKITTTTTTPDKTPQPGTTEETTSITMNTPPSGGPFTCPSENGYFSDPNSCESFYICYQWEASIRYCGDGLVYNPDTRTCDYPQDVPPPCGTCTSQFCQTNRKGVLLTSDIAPFTCPESNGRFPDPYDCASFYECADGIATLTKCPFGKLYNQELGECDYAQNVDCSNISPLPTQDGSTITVLSTTSEVPTTSSYPTTSQKPDLTTTPGEPFVCPGDGVFPHEDCSMFYQCANGGSNAQTCPPGLTFNPDILACDYPDNFFPPCGTRFPCPEPDGYFPNPDNCESYFVCSGGLSYEQVCSPGLVYNVESNVCDFPFNVPPPCGTASEERELVTDDITEEPITEPTPVWWFDCSIRNGFFPNPEDCTSYINCDNGNAWLLYCPNGTLYDATVERCTTNAPCTTSDFIRTSPNIQTATPDPNFECPEPNGLFANPLDCHSFYQCANNTPQFQFCPGNLHFSAEEEQCLDPSEANCQIYSFNFNN
ncbi:chitin-binding domain protein cbd-1-like isoform X1 [Artemia franciscana]|uniref:chitin-binding domain protein cbd-1-like isoform X1 n=1 Tax=Artemia franciscana TaxID=6661 RepID=UPI0032DA9D43